MDSIQIADLAIVTRIGITKEERAAPQRILINIELFFDLSKAATSDDIKDTIDYAAVTSAVKNLAETERCTIEKFAGDTAQMILKEFHPVSVKVSVWKFVLPDTRGVSVNITRP